VKINTLYRLYLICLICYPALVLEIESTSCHN